MTSTFGRSIPALAIVFALACGGSGEAGAPAPAESHEAVGSAAPAAVSDAVASVPVKVYKPTYCGCCTGWVEHLEHAGYTVEVEETDRPDEIKDELGVPAGLRSCHTAEIGGYVVEGHVPVDVIARLLQERPEVTGIAVPGMPVGSPGMEAADGRTDPYDIVAFDASGGTRVYESRR